MSGEPDWCEVKVLGKLLVLKWKCGDCLWEDVDVKQHVCLHRRQTPHLIMNQWQRGLMPNKTTKTCLKVISQGRWMLIKNYKKHFWLQFARN